MSRASARLSWAACAIAGLGAIACDSKARDEAHAMQMVIDRYREGTLDERPGRAASVVGQPCTQPDTCATKEACLRAITPFVEGLELRAKAKREASQLADGGGDIAAYQALDGVLARASDKVAEAEKNRQPCERALDAMKRTYRY